jgi:hypothetical protein
MRNCICNVPLTSHNLIQSSEVYKLSEVQLLCVNMPSDCRVGTGSDTTDVPCAHNKLRLLGKPRVLRMTMCVTQLCVPYR